MHTVDEHVGRLTTGYLLATNHRDEGRLRGRREREGGVRLVPDVVDEERLRSELTGVLVDDGTHDA